MTICIAVKVSEGLVLAADSLAVITGAQGQVLQLFEHAQKVTQLSDYPIGALVWGQAVIAQRSIDSIISEFSESLLPKEEAGNISVHEVATRLCAFVTEKYQAHYASSQAQKPDSLGILIGGFSTGSFFAEAYAFQLPDSASPTNQNPDLDDGSPQFNVMWFGRTRALNRLLNGFDPALVGELIGKENNPAQPEQIQAVLNKYAYPMIMNHMPLQDAIDFAMYLANVVIGIERFTTGIPLCGGQVDIAVITRKDFQWLKRKTWAVA